MEFVSIQLGENDTENTKLLSVVFSKEKLIAIGVETQDEYDELYIGEHELSKAELRWSDPLYLYQYVESVQGLIGQDDYWCGYDCDEIALELINKSTIFLHKFKDVMIRGNPKECFELLGRDEHNGSIIKRVKLKNVYGALLFAKKDVFRIYAIEVDDYYIITGSAIKVTLEMEDCLYTKDELKKLTAVRDYLIEEGVCDSESMMEVLEICIQN